MEVEALRDTEKLLFAARNEAPWGYQLGLGAVALLLRGQFCGSRDPLAVALMTTPCIDRWLASTTRQAVALPLSLPLTLTLPRDGR